MEKTKILLDASAYIAFLNKETGYDIIENVIQKASINTVTYTEIISFYARQGLDDLILHELCKYVNIININEDICFNAGNLIKISKEYGLSLGDRLCLATAIHYKLDVYTSDKIWAQLTKDLKLNIILIR